VSATARSASPRKRPAQRRSVETVERILDAAARLFDERGYRGTTTNHVAEAASVSVGSLYQYFPNKDALLVALARRHLHESAAAFADRLARLAASEPPLEEVTRSLIELALERNDSERLHAMLWTDAPRTPELVAQFESLTSVVVDEVARHLVRTGAGGPVAHRRAALLVAAVDAAVHDVVRFEPVGPQRRAAIEDLIHCVLHGIAPVSASAPAHRRRGSGATRPSGGC
jgi:AcrR family transcriptional regulator